MSRARTRGRARAREGFIALISAIIISAILLLVATTGGLTGIFARGDALDAELKARSVGAADACTDLALLALAGDPAGYSGGDTYQLNTLDECRVGTVSHASTCGGGSDHEFKVQAISSPTVSGGAVTNLDVCVATTDLSVISWQEIPTF